MAELCVLHGDIVKKVKSIQKDIGVFGILDNVVSPLDQIDVSSNFGSAAAKWQFDREQ